MAIRNYFSHLETDVPFNTVEIPSHLKQSLPLTTEDVKLGIYFTKFSYT